MRERAPIRAASHRASAPALGSGGSLTGSPENDTKVGMTGLPTMSAREAAAEGGRYRPSLNAASEGAYRMG